MLPIASAVSQATSFRPEPASTVPISTVKHAIVRFLLNVCTATLASTFLQVRVSPVLVPWMAAPFAHQELSVLSAMWVSTFRSEEQDVLSAVNL